jgi:Xaa-Pro aminopeptidase
VSVPFPRDEYEGRLRRLRPFMTERGVDAAIVDECDMLHDFTGFAISENLYRAAAGIAFSETVHVTAQGSERLTKIERRLFCCGEGAA